MALALGCAGLPDAPEGSTLWVWREECELGVMHVLEFCPSNLSLYPPPPPPRLWLWIHGGVAAGQSIWAGIQGDAGLEVKASRPPPPPPKSVFCLLFVHLDVWMKFVQSWTLEGWFHIYLLKEESFSPVSWFCDIHKMNSNCKTISDTNYYSKHRFFKCLKTCQGKIFKFENFPLTFKSNFEEDVLFWGNECLLRHLRETGFLFE